MLDFHKARNAEATILVTKVEDPTKYGVVVMDEYGQVQRFVEKPKVGGRGGGEEVYRSLQYIFNIVYVLYYNIYYLRTI